MSINSGWHPTGWRCATGHIIEMSLLLPAGVSARVHRKKVGHWQFAVRRHAQSNLKGKFKNRTAAMRAAESELLTELKSAVRMLNPKSGAA